MVLTSFGREVQSPTLCIILHSKELNSKFANNTASYTLFVFYSKNIYSKLHNQTELQELNRIIHRSTESQNPSPYTTQFSFLIISKINQTAQCILAGKRDTQLTFNFCILRYRSATRRGTKYKPPVSTPHYMDGQVGIRKRSANCLLVLV